MDENRPTSWLSSNFIKGSTVKVLDFQVGESSIVTDSIVNAIAASEVAIAFTILSVTIEDSCA